MRKLLSSLFVLVSIYSYSQSMCGGSSATIVPTSTLTNPSYTLNPGNFSPNTNGVFVVSPSVTTTYTLVATSGTTTNSSPVTVTVNPQPLSVPTLTQSSCTSSINALNLNLLFSPASPSPTYAIAWSSIPNGMLTPQQTSVTGVVSPGPYTATITAAGGCSLIVNFTMTPQPAPAIFTVNPFGSTHSITCVTPTVELTASNVNLTYTWTSTSFSPVVSNSISLNAFSLGTVCVTGQNPTSGCTTQYCFLIAQNISIPTSTISSTSINITCTQSVVPTLTISASPSVNVSNCIYAPNGTGTFCAQSYTTIYQPGTPGTYTVCSINNENGCSVCKTFTVTSSDSYPTFSVTSPQSFTLGCTTKSVATININNAQTTPTPGGAVSYTILPPNYTLTLPTGSLSNLNTYTVNVPGSWTVVVMDNSNNCRSTSVLSIIQNTFTPNISAVVPRQVLDCSYTTTVLQALSETSNVSYNWGFQGTPGFIFGPTITVNIDLANPTKTLINTYTLTITDNGNTCTSFSIIPMNQNTFPPKAGISNGGVNALTCLTPTIVLTNTSSTGIPPGTPFSTIEVVQGYTWYGPTPQDPGQLSSTYIAQVPGTYTLIAKDLNNSCVKSATIEILDNQKYPTINAPPVVATPSVIDCGAASVILAPVVTPSTGVSYSWTAPSATSIVGPKNLPTLSVKFPGTYSVIVTNSLNGCATKGSMVAINGVLNANFVSNVDSGFAPLPVIFTNNSSSSNSSSLITTSWNFANGTNTVTSAVEISPETIYTQAGNYKVTIYTIKGSCSDTAYRTIKVFIASTLTVPNVFTPNGDGANDLFFLIANNLTEVTMVIYDRWGHLTYEITSNTGNIEWDGKNQFGKECSEGVYFYYLKAKGLDGTAYDKNGTINLIR